MAYLQGHRFPHDRELTPLQRLTSELVQGVVGDAYATAPGLGLAG